MFENTLIPTRRRRWAIYAGYVVESMILAPLVLVPLIHVQALPQSLFRGIMEVGPPPPAGTPSKTTAVRAVHRPTLSEVFEAPVRIPATIPPSQAEPEAPSYDDAGTVPGGVPWGNGNGVPNGFGENGLPPAPEAPAKPLPASRIIVGGVVEAARLVYEVQPDYPAIAKSARVQGTVRLEAIIGKDGSVESLHAVSGPPLLIQSAMHGVAQWRYQPTLLDGVAVEVATEIDVTYSLSE